MIPDTISDIFQPINDFLYGLDVEFRPKLTPSAGTHCSRNTFHLRYVCWSPQILTSISISHDMIICW